MDRMTSELAEHRYGSRSLRSRFRITGIGRWALLGMCPLVLLVATDYPNLRDLASYGASKLVGFEANRLSTTEYSLLRRRYVEENRTITGPVVVFVGDSLTFKLSLDRLAFPRSVNRAIKGDTTVGVLSRLDDNVSGLVVECLFLMIGYNDLKFRSNEEILKNIGNIVTRVKAGRIVLQTVLPIDSRRRWFNKRIVDLNASIRLRYSKAGTVEVLDLYPKFESPDGNGIRESLAVDGVHLSRDGYRIWESCISNHMKERK